MFTAPNLNVNYATNNIVSKYGTNYQTNSSYNYSSSSKVFTDDQLRCLTQIVCELLNEGMQQFAFSVGRAIHQATPTPDQIHKLFLDKLMEHDK